jgi:hypothetical protein
VPQVGPVASSAVCKICKDTNYITIFVKNSFCIYKNRHTDTDTQTERERHPHLNSKRVSRAGTRCEGAWNPVRGAAHCP